MNEVPRKKVLIITYYWPPCGGIGVLRCLKMAKYLRQYGWEPIVYTAENAHYPSIDESNLKEIPEGMTVIKGKIWEPYHIYKYLTGQKKDANVNNIFYASEEKLGMMHKLSVWIRSNFFIPDARALWIKPSVKRLLEYLRENPVDAIISNGPPHSNTRIATLLKQKTGIPWLADFQDPWSQVDYFAMLRLTPWGLRKHLRMEQEVFRHADAISIVSDAWNRDLRSIGAKDVDTIAWGFDESDFSGIEPIDNGKFTITHVGLLGADRKPSALIAALQQLVQEIPDLREDLCLQMVGLVDITVKETIDKAGLGDYTHYTGSMNRDQALRYVAGSRVLLLLLNRQANANGRIPGKFFEYLAAERPILAIGPGDSDVSHILEQTAAGYNCDFDDVEACRQIITTLYRQYREKTQWKPNRHAIAQYSNQKLTGRFAEILNRITQKGNEP